MTHTYEITNLGASTESVTLEVAPKSSLGGPNISTDPKTGEISATYPIAAGDAQYPSSITFKAMLLQPKNGTPVKKLSVIFRTWATDYSSVTDETSYREVTTTMNIYLPADMTIELADAKKLLGTFFSFLYPSVTTGTWSTAWLQDLLYGVVQVV